MPRIQGVDLPGDKPTHISLRYLRGIGPTTSLELCAKCGLDPQRRAKELSDDDVAKLAQTIDSQADGYLVEGALRRYEGGNIARLKEIKSYRGERHRKNLPARGQRSKTNARTRKGPRKTVAGKKGVKDK
ncbi:30S ribosomal protein S13 [soil metagenome]